MPRSPRLPTLLVTSALLASCAGARSLVPSLTIGAYFVRSTRGARHDDDAGVSLGLGWSRPARAAVPVLAPERPRFTGPPLSRCADPRVCAWERLEIARAIARLEGGRP